MMKIKDYKKRILVKEYIDIEVDKQEYCVYICNDVVAGIYKRLEDGSTDNAGHKALCDLTGMTKAGFIRAIAEFVEITELMEI